MPGEITEVVENNPEILRLREEYLRSGILEPGSFKDAEHVAAATFADVDLLISWNMKHIANPARVRRFSEVNVSMGYRSIPIYTPKVVMQDEIG